MQSTTQDYSAFLVEDYFLSFKSDYTRYNVISNLASFFGIKVGFGEKEQRERLVKEKLGFFLSLERMNAEGLVSSWILQMKERGHGYHPIHNPIKALQSFCSHCDYFLPWKRIMKKLPPQPRSRKNHSPEPSQIASIFETADNRLKFIISAETSGGYRVGAYNYPLRLKELSVFELGSTITELGWKDFIEEASGSISIEDFFDKRKFVGKIIIYRDEPEEYPALISDEALFWFLKYYQERKSFGEELQDYSPLFRDKINPLNRHLVSPKANQLTRNAVMSLYNYAWIRAGLPYEVRKWKATHFCRAYHWTQLENANMKTLHIKILRGDVLEGEGIENASHYYDSGQFRPIIEDYCEKMPALYISGAFRSKVENRRIRMEKEELASSISTKLQLMQLEMERKDREYKAKMAELERILGSA